tara:strand:+ start:362 stop:484 length:123 start_codon:yes stop_codon:yes gene_type:complete
MQENSKIESRYIRIRQALKSNLKKRKKFQIKISKKKENKK